MSHKPQKILDLGCGDRKKQIEGADVIGIEYVVNKFQRYYERFFAFILPAAEVYFEFEVIKNTRDENSSDQ